MQANMLLEPSKSRRPYTTRRNDRQTRVRAHAMVDNHITSKILGNAFKVHTSLGPGLMESAYEECLYYELKKAGLKVDKQKPLPVKYKDIHLEAGYRLDLLVEDKVIVEIKSVDQITDIHIAQMQTYLKMSGCKVGVLINFNVKSLRQGIRRVFSESSKGLLNTI